MRVFCCCGFQALSVEQRTRCQKGEGGAGDRCLAAVTYFPKTATGGGGSKRVQTRSLGLFTAWCTVNSSHSSSSSSSIGGCCRNGCPCAAAVCSGAC